MEGRGWWHDAACNQADPELFFDPDREQQAKQCCRGCSVKEQCLSEEQGKWGVFGGFNGHERNRIHAFLG